MSIRIVPQGLPPGFNPWERQPVTYTPKLCDMTLAQIHEKHGDEVASYIRELRGNAEMWRRLYNQRLSDQQSSTVSATSEGK